MSLSLRSRFYFQHVISHVALHLSDFEIEKNKNRRRGQRAAGRRPAIPSTDDGGPPATPLHNKVSRTRRPKARIAGVGHARSAPAHATTASRRGGAPCGTLGLHDQRPSPAPLLSPTPSAVEVAAPPRLPSQHPQLRMMPCRRDTRARRPRGCGSPSTPPPSPRTGARRRLKAFQPAVEQPRPRTRGDLEPGRPRACEWRLQRRRAEHPAPWRIL